MPVAIKGKMEVVNIGRLVPNPWNPNAMTPEMEAKEKASLLRFGVVRAVVVRELPGGRLEIIDGEHRWKILKDSGAVEIPVRNLGEVGDAEAKSLTIALNEIRGTTDFYKLADLFASLEDYTPGEIAELLPFKEGEVQALIDASGFDWGAYSQDYTETKVSEYGTLPCRVRALDAPRIGEKAAQLCVDLGIGDKNEAVRLGGLFQHLLIQRT